MELRRSADRFCTQTGWLTSRHSFSYGQWYDAGNVGFGPLVVLNHDVLGPGAGFDDHEHHGVDLVTLVISGSLEHRDSTGHVAVLGADELQVLHAGSGIVHSERNASAQVPVEYVQMWLRSSSPATSYLRPAGRSLRLPAGDLVLIELPAAGSVTVPADELVHLYLLSGSAENARLELGAGDALRARGEELRLESAGGARLLAWSLRA